MKLLYTHPNRILVENCKNIMANAGIDVILRNEYAGSGMGELAPINTWLELWVVNDKDLLRAKDIVSSTFADSNSEPWTCKNCGEQNEASFDFCWHCQQEKPAPA